MTSDLLATKLHRPPIPAQWLPRPRLNRRLDEAQALRRRLTLVSAPAGYGKTMCVAAWAETISESPLAWLSLDPADNDPRRFFAYLLAAVQKLNAGLGRDLIAVIHAGQLPPAEVISTTLINEIVASSGSYILVLDDFHAVREPAILQFMQFLLLNQPPDLHLVLIMRADPPLPLARLRANNQLAEIRAADLLFTAAESGRLLNDVLSLSLAPADIRTLEARTEGWAAGLQLAGLSIRGHAAPSDFIANLHGGQRHIAGYLTEEVLDRQPRAVRDFLLETSILEALNPDLCNAVTGRSDAHEMLETLLRANLFLIPLDNQQHWYRYHHLFAGILRSHLNRREPEETAALHSRAARWYEEAGMAAEAIQHTLAAEDYAQVVRLLERHAMGLVMQGYARTVHGWLQAVPVKWSMHSPRTDLAFAWMHLLRGDYARATPHLKRAEAALQEPRPEEAKRALHSECLVMHSLVCYREGEMARSAAFSGQALAAALEGDDHVRSLAYYALGSARRAQEAFDPAAEAFRMAIAHGRAADNLLAELMSVVGLASMAFERGQLHLAFEIASAAVARVEQSGTLPPICGVLYGVLADVFYQWDRIDEARAAVRRAQQLTTLGGYRSGRIGCHIFLCRLARREGDLETAVQEMQQAAEMAQDSLPDYVRQELIAQQVHLELDRDYLAGARLALQSAGYHDGALDALPDGVDFSYSAGLLFNSVLCLRLHEAHSRRDRSRLAAAVKLADRLIARAKAGQYRLVMLEALLLRAQVLALCSGPSLDAAQADYLRALELGEPQGFTAVFAEQGAPVRQTLAKLHRQRRLGPVNPDYVERILAAFSGSQHDLLASPQEEGRPPDALPEPLSDRELDVLRLLAAGMTYKDIAAALFVSVNTVRFHVKAIYGKLQVHNRTQAVETARASQLI